MAKSQLKYDRIVVLIDMDCFYCQVEEKLNPSLKGKPMVVVQYNAWKGGGIIAVNYPARDNGVTRHMRGDEAKKHCPEIELVRVPSIREKADLSKYRDAGKEVASVLQTYTSLLERASVDEAYLDITETVLVKLKEMNEGSFMLEPEKLTNTYAVGYEKVGDFVENISTRLKPTSGNSTGDCDEAINHNKNDIKLLIGAAIVNEIRADVKKRTGYECSAGIAHNKILAKLVCGINKPNKQTLLPLRHLNQFYKTLQIKKIKGLGGKFGDDVCDTLQIKLMSELEGFAQEELQRQFDEKNGLWLYLIARGIDLEAVTPRFASKSIGCCKKFPGRTAINGMATLTHWLKELSKEIIERLEKDEVENNRRATQMVVSFVQEINNVDMSSSRSITLKLVDEDKMANDALDVIRRNTQTFCKSDAPAVLHNPIKFLGVNVGKFEDIQSGRKNTIQGMFNNQAKKKDVANSIVDSNGANMNSDVKCDALVEKGKIKGDTTSNTKSYGIQNAFIKQAKQKVAEPEPNVAKTSQTNTNCKSFFNNLTKNVTGETISTESPSEVPEIESDFTENDEEIENYKKNISTESDGIEPTPLTPVKLKPSGENDESLQNPQANDEPSINYQQTYAEYYCQPLIQLEQCTQCKKNVPSNEMKTHSDSHFAYQLSQQQRMEYRSQLLQIKSTPSPPVAKKPRIGQKPHKIPHRTKALEKFFVKESISDQTELINNLNGGNCSMEKCADCSKLIPIEKLPEHIDYHVARKMQQELNKAAIGMPSISKKRLKKTNRSSNGNVQSVSSFFKQSN